MGDLDDGVFSEFQENNEWDACFNAIEEWDQEQELIAKSNTLDEDTPRPEYLEVLHRCFGHKSFRPMQWKIISSIINDRRDNCAIMATGYGKSLCFQYPSVYVGGVTLVISPLISLMEDQVLSMQMSNISACLLGTAQENKRQALEDILENKYSLVYLTPELCCSDYGQYVLESINARVSIVLIAIDEAHCVSSWGHDFRHQYRQLWKLRDVLPNVPILAVTATATPRVRSDIVSCLKLKNPQVLCSGFDRPNLQFSVFLKGAGVISDLKKAMVEKNGCLSFPGSTIVYCITRKQTEDVAQQITQRGIKCLAYHAGMSVKARKEAHEKFAKDKVKTIVATIAFGMGIDKPDVRNVIHYGASKDIESYYQEVGRAGRDGQPSNCITFYNNADFDMHETIREMGGINQTNRDRRQAMEKIMLQYLETRDCRRQFILNHFEGLVTPKKPKPKCCDNCTRKVQNKGSDSSKYKGLNEKGLYDFTVDAHIFLTAVEAMGGKFGFQKYILFIRGSKTSAIYENLHRHPGYGKGKSKSNDWWKAIARLMEREGYLKKAVHKTHGKGRSIYNTYSINTKGVIFLQNMKNGVSNIKIMLAPSPDIFNLWELNSEPISPEATNSKPSTSRKSLKLVTVPSKTSSIDSDSQNENGENDIEKEERMKVYRLLMNKRAELASAVDCMPYMVASNEALMKMAQMKPVTTEELRKCQLEGFTEAKINRFGEEFIKTMRAICKLDSVKIDAHTKRSIQDILAEKPLPGFRIGATAEASYSMYKSGLTVQEISTKRGVIAATVLSHLVDGIKAGYPIKLIDLNVTDEMRDTIINVIRKPPINSDTSALTPIKNACPEEISFNDIKVVIAYLQVRNHLAKLGVAYEDFETPMAGFIESQNHTMTSESQRASNAKPSPSLLSGSKIKRGSLSPTKKHEKRDAHGDSTDDLFVDSSPVNPPKKKQKLKLANPSASSERNNDLDFLDSPPRSTHKLSSQRKTAKELVILESPPKKRTLSPQKHVDFEKSLEDDFFDNIILDDVDKVVSSQSTINKLNSPTEYIKQEGVREQYSKNEFNKEDALSPSSSANSNTASQQNKFKKFQFKSKVPQSVLESTKQLFSPQPIQPIDK